MIASRTPEGFDYCCPICATEFIGLPSEPMGELVCPACGSLVVVAIDLASLHISQTTIDLFPESILREHGIFPVSISRDTIYVAASNVKDSELVERLSFILNCRVFFVLAREDDIQTAIRRHFG